MEPLFNFLPPPSTTILNMIISVDMIQEINHTVFFSFFYLLALNVNLQNVV